MTELAKADAEYKRACAESSRCYEHWLLLPKADQPAKREAFVAFRNASEAAHAVWKRLSTLLMEAGHL